MEQSTNQAAVPIKTFKEVFPPEHEVQILETGITIKDIIDKKINELATEDNDEPFCVANLDSVFKRHKTWIAKLPRVQPFYAFKCNNILSIINMLKVLNTGFDCASKAEIEMVLSLGVSPDRIIYAHTTKPISHIRYASCHGVDIMTFDSEEELWKISQYHSQPKLVLRIAVDDSRSQRKLSDKFGASLSSAGNLLEYAKKLDLKVIGVSFHVGCGCLEVSGFKTAIADARYIFGIAELLGFKMNLLDIGGGFFGREDTQLTFEEAADAINKSLDELFPPESGVKVIAEPGRYFVECALTLAVKVFAKRVIEGKSQEKRNPNDSSLKDEERKSHPSPDRTLMYFVNDGIYGTLSCLVNAPEITKVEPYLQRAVGSDEPRYRSTIWGPTCDSLDKLVKDYWIPELKMEEWLLINNMGAYSINTGSEFNGFKKSNIFPVVSTETYNTLGLGFQTYQ